MNNQTSVLAPVTEQAKPLSTQAAKLAALLAMTEMFGSLPSGYITIHNSDQEQVVGLQLDAVCEFEAWRSALLIPAEDVELKGFRGSAWLSADGEFHGVTIHLTGYGIEVPAAEERAA